MPIKSNFIFSAVISAHVDKIHGVLQNISAEEVSAAPVAGVKTMIVVLTSPLANWFFMTPSIATTFQYINSL
jgi:hypothetical protein